MSGNKKELYRYLLLGAVLYSCKVKQTGIYSKLFYLYKGKLFCLPTDKNNWQILLADTTGRYYWQILLADTTGRYYWQILLADTTGRYLYNKIKLFIPFFSDFVQKRYTNTNLITLRP